MFTDAREAKLRTEESLDRDMTWIYNSILSSAEKGEYEVRCIFVNKPKQTQRLKDLGYIVEYYDDDASIRIRW